MALPEEVATVNLTGTYVNLDGTPTVGYLMFEPSPQILKAADSREFVVPKVMQVNLDDNGAFSIQLPANDDPDVEPLHWTYHVTEAFGARRTYNIEIHVAAGPTQNIYDLAPVALANGTFYEQGDRGPAGPPAIITTGKPADTVGVSGDYAIDASAGMLYTKTGSTWDNGTQIGRSAAITLPVKTYIDNADQADQLYSDGKLSAHANTSSGTHGVVGVLVGTTDTQTLSNKILSAPSVTGGLSTDTITTTGAATVGGALGAGSTTVTSLKVNGAVDATGQTITAAHVTVANDPVASTDAATKNYIDNTVGTSNSTASALMRRDTNSAVRATGFFADNGAPSWPDELTRKDYVNSQDAAMRRVTTNNQPSTAYTFALTDEGKVVYYNVDSSAVTYTIPTNATVAFSTGAWIDVYAGASGTVTITGASGVTLRGPDGVSSITLRATYSKVRITKSNTDTWQWSGDAVTTTSSTVASATSLATVSTLAKRDAAGRLQVVDPSVAADVATKNYTDTQTALRVLLTSKNAANGYVGLDASSNATVAGTLTVSGLTKAPNFEATTAVLLDNQAADPSSPGATGQAVLWKASTGLWTVSQDQILKRRISTHWGSGTAFPVAGIGAGDTYLRTDVGTNGSIYQYSGSASNGASGWMIEDKIYCTSTTVPTAGLYSGISRFDTDTKSHYVYNGTGWVAYAAATDTGWVSIGLNAPVNTAGSGFFYRVLNGVVFLRFNSAYTGTWGNTFNLQYLPVAARPAYDQYLWATWYGNGPALIHIQASDGQCITANGNGASPGGILGNLTFSLA